MPRRPSQVPKASKLILRRVHRRAVAVSPSETDEALTELMEDCSCQTLDVLLIAVLLIVAIRLVAVLSHVHHRNIST